MENFNGVTHDEISRVLLNMVKGVTNVRIKNVIGGLDAFTNVEIKFGLDSPWEYLCTFDDIYWDNEYLVIRGVHLHDYIRPEEVT